MSSHGENEYKLDFLINPLLTLTRDIVIGQLVAAVTSAFERSWNIDAALRTTAVTCLTFVYICEQKRNQQKYYTFESN